MLPLSFMLPLLFMPLSTMLLLSNITAALSSSEPAIRPITLHPPSMPVQHLRTACMITLATCCSAMRVTSGNAAVRSVPARGPLSRVPTARLSGPEAAALSLTQPSQAEAETMGLRDWPQTAQSERSAEDRCADGALRYVLEGSGTVQALPGETLPVSPNTLVRVSGDVTLRWTVDEGVDELVLLSPEYRGPPLAPIAAAVLFLFVALIASTTGG